ncbi:MAG: excinuclease ABC subunit UvrC [Oceanobacter sp.]
MACASREGYESDIRQAQMFLRGESQALLKQLQEEMIVSAEQLEFERAAELRDRIDLLRRVQEKQAVDSGSSNTDVWAITDWQGVICIHRLAFRDGRLMGSKNFYPENLAGEDLDAFLISHASQFYIAEHAVDGMPSEIILDVESDQVEALIEAIQIRFKIRVMHSRGQRGKPRQWRHMAEENARAGAQSRISGHKKAREQLDAAARLLSIDQSPQRIECFDISHSKGEATYASCVVFEGQGLAKNRYRRFSIKGVAAGDDYAALEQAVTRHLTRLKEQDDLPDILLIDGGKGQVSRVSEVLDKLEISTVNLWGISKGETRKSGWEFLWKRFAKDPVIPDAHDEGFRLLQLVRDESHRFAISGHRKARSKSRGQSELEQLPGIGPKRRRALLLHFGSLKNMKSAPREEFSKVEGVSQKLAEKIFSQLHGET